MRKRLLLFFAIAACILLPQCFPIFWKTWISLPVLQRINAIGGRIPFSVLEWGAVLLCAWIAAGFLRRTAEGNLRRAVLRVIRRVLCVFIMLLTAFSALWMPLYERTEEYSASAEQLRSCAEMLMKEIELEPPDFSEVPDDLPAKYAAFPFWMRKVNISGFYSFFTGETLLSPELDSAAIPFVAVHESIHSRGIADEGMCNILAYEECLVRGGAYRDSAKLWALHYLLGELRRTDYGAYADCVRGMDSDTINLLHRIGGIYEKTPQGTVQQAFARLTGGGDYEILAHYLAVKMRG